MSVKRLFVFSANSLKTNSQFYVNQNVTRHHLTNRRLTQRAFLLHRRCSANLKVIGGVVGVHNLSVRITFAQD